MSCHPDDCGAHAKFSANKGADLVAVWVTALTSGQVGHVKPSSSLDRQTHTHRS